MRTRKPVGPSPPHKRFFDTPQAPDTGKRISSRRRRMKSAPLNERRFDRESLRISLWYHTARALPRGVQPAAQRSTIIAELVRAVRWKGSHQRCQSHRKSFRCIAVTPKVSCEAIHPYPVAYPAHALPPACWCVFANCGVSCAVSCVRPALHTSLARAQTLRLKVPDEAVPSSGC